MSERIGIDRGRYLDKSEDLGHGLALLESVVSDALADSGRDVRIVTLGERCRVDIGGRGINLEMKSVGEQRSL